MKLSEIDLKGLGKFEDAPASFTIERYYLPVPWDYVYANGRVLLRIRHNGGGYLQVDPPGGPGVFAQEKHNNLPMFMTWILPHGPSGFENAFTNFFGPTAPLAVPGQEPQEFRCTFAPEAARWHVVHQGFAVDTEIFVPPTEPAMVCTTSVTNTTGQDRTVTLMPVSKPFMADFVMAPWDVPHWYQTCGYCGYGDYSGFWLEIRDPNGIPEKRFRTALMSDLGADQFETVFDRFVGKGHWASPEALATGTLAQGGADKALPAYGHSDDDNSAVGQAIVAAMARKVTIPAGGTFSFTIVWADLPRTSTGRVPPVEHAMKFAQYFDPQVRKDALAAVKAKFDQLFAARSLNTPDEALNQYTRSFLPIQLYWVMMLDRGWPTGDRGVRDSAQDTQGMIPMDPKAARARVLEICMNQRRSDGWFPRSFPVVRSRNFATHGHVDAGAWVWEFLYDYVCYTRDFAVLDAKIDWMDSDAKDTILHHMLKGLEYFLRKENIGEHGLCKIRHGDWNDAVNTAGLKGRGETTMVTCQVVMALEQAAGFLEFLARKRKKPSLIRTANKYAAAAGKFRQSLNKHAMNKDGFYNAVFNDLGKWLFSIKDPDGKRRVNGPANSFAVIAGVPQGPKRRKVLENLDSLKGPCGWRLFYPPMGEPPIKCAGRLGPGDLAPGLLENGTPYNHGSHGFLARAACAAGAGDFAYQVMRYMLPYYQDAHPVLVSRIAPYGVANHWRENVSQRCYGGEVFLSGSISTALRNIYDHMLGFRPRMEEIQIDPVIPSDWKELSAEVPFLGGRYTIKITNPRSVQSGVAKLMVNGKQIGSRYYCPRLQREVAAIPLSEIKSGKDYTIEVEMGN